MTSAQNMHRSIQYPDATIQRAERAMRCSPFQLNLFVTMIHGSVALGTIAGASGLEQQFTRRALAELVAEAELLWLIQVGLLRREVDGQGLTDSFRVTPLGRQLAQKWQLLEPTAYTPSWSDRLYNTLSRWPKFPV